MCVSRLFCLALAALAIFSVNSSALNANDGEYVIACPTRELAERLIGLDQGPINPQILQTMLSLNKSSGKILCSMVRAILLGKPVEEVRHKKGLGLYRIIPIQSVYVPSPLDNSLASKLPSKHSYTFAVTFFPGYLI